MIKTILLALAALSLTAAASKRPASPPPLGDVVRVALNTEAGTIVLDLDHKRAPVTVENFVRYVDGKRLDGTTFYRSLRMAWGEQPNGLIQGGPKGEPARVFKPIALESTSASGLKHVAGTISMARLAPDSATGDFFILLSDMSSLDADPAKPGDNMGYAAFGNVVEGMDVVRAIYDAPLSLTQGEGALKGQMIDKPVRIVSAKRVARLAMEPPVAAPAPAPPSS